MENTIANTPKSLFRDKEHYLKFIAAFKKSAQEKNLTTEHFMLYAMFRNRDWRKGFTPCTRKTKLANGRKPHDTMIAKYESLRFMLSRPAFFTSTLKPFSETITPEMMKGLLNYLPAKVELPKEVSNV